MTISQLRRILYRTAAGLGDVDAARRGPTAYLRRRARRHLYRIEGRYTRRLLRALGLHR